MKSGRERERERKEGKERKANSVGVLHPGEEERERYGKSRASRCFLFLLVLGKKHCIGSEWCR